MENFTFVTNSDNANAQQQNNASELLTVVEEIRETADQTEKNTFAMLTIVEEIRESVKMIRNVVIFYCVLTLLGIVSAFVFAFGQ